jgi:CRISPR-associated protein Cmr1
MNKFTVELETITPMFSYGNDKYKPEFRVTELKSLMRNTYREFYNFNNLKEMKEKEAELFGDLNKKSPFSIKVSDPKKINFNKLDLPLFKILTPHKILNQKNIEAKNIYNLLKEDKIYKLYEKLFDKKISVKVDFIVKDKKSEDFYKELLVDSSIFGGLGRRVRKGFGCFKVKEKDLNEKIPENNFEYLKKFKKLEYFKDSNMIKKLRIIELEDEYSKVILELSALTHNAISKGKINERLSSPIYITFWESEYKKYIIIKELNYDYLSKYNIKEFDKYSEYFMDELKKLDFYKSEEVIKILNTEKDG